MTISIFWNNNCIRFPWTLLGKKKQPKTVVIDRNVFGFRVHHAACAINTYVLPTTVCRSRRHVETSFNGPRYKKYVIIILLYSRERA